MVLVTKQQVLKKLFHNAVMEKASCVEVCTVELQ